MELSINMIFKLRASEVNGFSVHHSVQITLADELVVVVVPPVLSPWLLSFLVTI